MLESKGLTKTRVLEVEELTWAPLVCIDFPLLHLLSVLCDGTSVAFTHWHYEYQLSKSPWDQTISQSITESPLASNVAVWPLTVGCRFCKAQIHASKHTNTKHRCTYSTLLHLEDYTLEVYSDSSINQLSNIICNQCLKWTNTLWHGKIRKKTRTRRTKIENIFSNNYELLLTVSEQRTSLRDTHTYTHTM